MGYHINLYSANKKKAEAFDFNVERFKKGDEDYDYWSTFSKSFGKVFTREFEIGSFLKYEKLEKIESSYGKIYKISKDDFLDIIIQYNEYMFNYYKKMEDNIRMKLEGTLTKDDEALMLIDLYDFTRTKAWMYNKWSNNLRMDVKDKQLTNGWEFETDIIELVRIYKSINFDNTSLICVGS